MQTEFKNTLHLEFLKDREQDSGTFTVVYLRIEIKAPSRVQTP